MNTRHFRTLPKAYLSYPKVVQGLIFKKKAQQHALPELSYVVDQFQVDEAHLKAYNRVCGFKDNGYIPAIYLAVLSQSLQMHMMTSEDFNYPILGLVHLSNQIKQLRKIASKEKLRLDCRFGELRPHHKGMQFDFITEVYVGTELVVQAVSTYLSKQKNPSARLAQVVVSADQATPDYVQRALWHIDENIGRRYALISGDFNLIHLHALTAKAFGFKRAIAHGMWTNARALASLPLADAYQADVQFKLPVYLPSTVNFLVAEHAGQQDFLIENEHSHKPHVQGVVIRLS
ncbi:MaoC family dehydratase [Acinetobacter larvae]|uniref:MaoC-like domain-containing protein n=1 Tax=Acinetobacter larvae TaxID=1789224 RepID=A0A1B2LZ00_9GAMM|nr:MaoC/PaaZ C-terminal domain-containing protein [Acinetobacter larvae]AOA58003.1 hypothetical protein BFG52_06325 [Acinetobacter larvae]